MTDGEKVERWACPYCAATIGRPDGFCPHCGAQIEGNKIYVEGHNPEEVLHVARELSKTVHRRARLPSHLATSRGDRLLGLGAVLIAAGAAMTATTTDVTRWIGAGVIAVGVILGVAGFFSPPS